jgi:hypothetical protein
MARVRCVVPVLLFAVALPLVAQQKGRTRPPAELHRVGDHWTAYNPPDPATFPAGSKVHIIEKGDTLWDLANRFYNSPYLWPQLWEANTYITDAHWIYPGDPLLIQGEVSTAPDSSANLSIGATGGDEGALTANVSAPLGPPIALGSEADVFCFGYLGHPDEEMPNHISSFEDVEVKLVAEAKVQDIGVGEGDVVYIEGDETSGIIPGETYIVVKPGQLVEHPDTGEVVGRHYDYRGQVRILCINEGRATGLVTQSCTDIHLGDRLKPVPLIPIPLARQTAMADVCSTSSGKVNGHIVNAKDYFYALGEGSLIEIDLGRDDFVEPGDFLTVFRDNPESGNPRQILGEIGILTAEGNTATARITRMKYSMRVGDRVELK